MSQRLAELSVIAENDEDVALQLESERFLTPSRNDIGDPGMIAWAEDIADSYLIVTAPVADEATIQKLAEEVDF